MPPSAFDSRALILSFDMVELLIRKDGVWSHLDTFGDEAFTAVLQRSDVARLQDFKASYSFDFELPRSKRNRELLGFPEEHDMRSRISSAEIPVRAYADGAQIIGPGFKLVIDEITDTYSVRIASLLPDLFSRMEKLDFSELQLPAFPWTAEEIMSPGGAERMWPMLTPAYVHPAQGLRRRSLEGFYSWDYGGKYIDSRRPAYSLRYLVERIFEHFGYALDVTTAAAGSSDDTYFNFSELRGYSGALDYIEHQVVGPNVAAPGELDTPLSLVPQFTDMSTIPGQSVFRPVRSISGLPNPQVDERPLLPTLSALTYVFSQHVSVKVRIITAPSGPLPTTNEFRVRFRVAKYQQVFQPSGVVKGNVFDETTSGGAVPYEEAFAPEVISETPVEGIGLADMVELGNGIWESEVAEMNPGERLYVEAYVMHGAPGYSVFCSFELHPQELDSEIGPGALVRPQMHMPFKNPKEAVQLFAHIYGLSVQLDDEDGIVSMRSLSDLDFGSPVDWSDKVSYVGNSISFAYGAFANGASIAAGQALPYPVDLGSGMSEEYIDSAEIPTNNANVAGDPEAIALPINSSVSQEVRRDFGAPGVLALAPNYANYPAPVAPVYESEGRELALDLLDAMIGGAIHTEENNFGAVPGNRRIALYYMPTEVISVEYIEDVAGGAAISSAQYVVEGQFIRLLDSTPPSSNARIVYRSETASPLQLYAKKRPVIVRGEKVVTIFRKLWNYDNPPTPPRYAYTGLSEAVDGTDYLLPEPLVTPLTAADVVDQGYSTLRDRVLMNVFVVEADVRLSAADIAELDFNRPILLAKYGDYFILNRIDQYSPGKIARATFIALNTQ